MANPGTSDTRRMQTNLVDMLTGTQQGWFCTVSSASQVNKYFSLIFFLIFFIN
jgi:hypothetical protein